MGPSSPFFCIIIYTSLSSPFSFSFLPSFFLLSFLNGQKNKKSPFHPPFLTGFLFSCFCFLFSFSFLLYLLSIFFVRVLPPSQPQPNQPSPPSGDNNSDSSPSHIQTPLTRVWGRGGVRLSVSCGAVRWFGVCYIYMN